MAQATSDAEQIVTDYIDAWNNGDYAKIPSLVAESATIHDPGAPEGALQGHDELEAHLKEIRSGFPDFTISIEEMLASDDVVMVDWTLTATHEGTFNDIPPTEREIELTGMSKTVVRDGRVQSDRIYYDFHDFLEQLGLVDE